MTKFSAAYIQKLRFAMQLQWNTVCRDENTVAFEEIQHNVFTKQYSATVYAK